MKQVQEKKLSADASHSDLIKKHPEEMSAGQRTESRAFSGNGTREF